MAKPVKKSTSRAVVGNTKKSNGSFKVSKHMVLVVLAAVLAISVAGGLGWQQWQDNQVRAKASGWTSVSWDGVSVYLRACYAGNSVYREYVSNYSNYALKFNGVTVSAHSNSGAQNFQAGQTGWIVGPQSSAWGWLAGQGQSVTSC